MEVDEPTSEMSFDCSTEETPPRLLQEISHTATSGKNAQISAMQAENTLKAGADTSGNTFGAEKAGALDQSELNRANDTSISKQASSQQPATDTGSLLSTVMQEESSSNTTKTSSPGSVSIKPLSAVISGSMATTPTLSSYSTVFSSSQPETTELDSNKIVALKIIISDEQEQQASDPALNQAVSSISGDRIPTIFLSPPANPLTKVLPSTPRSSITPEETAQAVSSLQGVESAGDPVISAPNNLQPAQTQSTAPEAGFIQLLPANPAFGAPSSYFVVTDPSSRVNQHSGMMLLPGAAGEGAVCSTPQVVATPPRSRAVVSIASNVAPTFSTGKSKNFGLYEFCYVVVAYLF